MVVKTKSIGHNHKLLMIERKSLVVTKVKSPEKSGLSETGEASAKDHLSVPAAATLAILKDHQKIYKIIFIYKPCLDKEVNHR